MAQQQQQYIQYAPQPAMGYPTTAVYASPYAANQAMQVVQVAAGVPYSPPERKYSARDARGAVVLGAIQIVTGCFCIIFQSVAISLEQRLNRPNFTAEFVGAGIWCGTLYLFTGIIGICAGKKNAAGLIITYMVFNIFCAIVMWNQLGFAAANLGLITSCRQGGAYQWSSYPSTYYSRYYCTDAAFDTWIAMDATMLILAILQFIVSVTASAYCCKACCGCCNSNPGYVMRQPGHTVYVPTSAMHQQTPGVAVGYPGQANAGHASQAAYVQPAYPQFGGQVQGQHGFIQQAAPAGAAYAYPQQPMPGSYPMAAPPVYAQQQIPGADQLQQPTVASAPPAAYESKDAPPKYADAVMR